MSINCEDYNSEDCLKGNNVTIINDLNEIIVLACWGVYCQSGNYKQYKKKKGEINSSEVVRGQRDVFRGIEAYSNSGSVSDVFFAGDNVYQYAHDFESKVPDVSEMGYRIDKQLEEFNKCYSNIKNNVKRTFIGIGNHDVETCDILNTELNYNGWQKMGVYYSVDYIQSEEKSRGVTVIVLDTNMYEKEQLKCNQKDEYTDQERDEQRDFVKQAYTRALEKNNWIIMIGHIPALANGHKKGKEVVRNEKLYNLIREFRPHIYICGDEHNQQFIYDPKIKVSLAVIGSGGTDLDNVYFQEANISPVDITCYAEKIFGFLTLKFSTDVLNVSFKHSDPNGSLTLKYDVFIDNNGDILRTYPENCSSIIKSLSS